MLKFASRVLGLYPKQMTSNQIYRFGYFSDKMTEKQSKKQEEEFHKQIEHLANKPSFTLMDYKQRIHDELGKLKGSFRKKMSSDAQTMEKDLEDEKKILNALFEEELNGEEEIDLAKKKQISLVTSQPIDKINEVFKKATRQQKIHTLLRGMKENGDQLPRSMNELQYFYQKSGLETAGKKERYLKYKFWSMHKGLAQKKRREYIAREKLQ